MDELKIPKYIAVLKDRSNGFHVRGNAAEALKKIGSPAVPALVEALKDEDKDVRAHAAETLGNIGDPSAIPALTEALNDAGVRIIATEALGKLGASGVPALVEALRCSHPGVNITAASALGRVRNAAAVSALIEALNHREPGVRATSAVSLGKIADGSAIPALMEALIDVDSEVRNSAGVALGSMVDPMILTRTILADPRFSAQQRIDVLETLRRAQYGHRGVALRGAYADIRTLCRAVVIEADGEACKGAQTVLNWLNGDRDLLKSSQRDDSSEPRELLRAAQGRAAEIKTRE